MCTKEGRTRRSTCGIELSYSKMALSKPRRLGTAIGNKMSKMYRSAFKLQSIRTRDAHAMYPMAAQTITLDAVDIECKQTICGLLGASRHVYGHQNSVRRTGTRLKRRHCTSPVSTFVVRGTKVTISLYVALSSENEIMVI
ncbi:hypothetical protein HNY73_004468 [Argiope bruennichi]|uniref:Uncharacterized protein n=1 Tax=Argiope bruennichi TaxID=94029 RepID=A0A8T0FTT8_ARGBR|nr:hypothetical protein HNY73_004468 [Argiope bruennichi]